MKTLSNLIRIKLLYLGYLGNRISRFFYWNIRLAQGALGKGIRLHFPLIIEGSGKLSIGDGAELMKRVSIGLSPGSHVIIGNGSRIHAEANIHAGKDTTIRLGEKCSVLTHATLRNRKGVELGKGSSVSSYCNIFPREPGYDGRFVMGEGSNIGDNTISGLYLYATENVAACCCNRIKCLLLKGRQKGADAYPFALTREICQHTGTTCSDGTTEPHLIY